MNDLDNSQNIFRPYDDKPLTLGMCRCGKHQHQHQCDSDSDSDNHPSHKASPLTKHPLEKISSDLLEAVAIKAILPHEPTRRAFLRAVGKSSAMLAVASVLPLANLQQALAIDRLTPEKKSVDIGFLPILCATPLIMADPLGYYAEQGLRANLHKRAGWALVRDQMINRKLDATHFLAPMPLAISLGLGSAKEDMKVAAILNTNGQALVMALKHKNNKNPKNWKGMTFAIPFEHSIHNYLLRYFLAEHGIDPDKDVKLRLTTPPDMIANLKAGNIDGFFGPEPFNQRAVWDKAGYIHTLSRDIWHGHPCCSFGTSQSFIDDYPQTFLAMYRAILKANVLANEPSIRKDLSKLLAPANYLNQPELVLRQAMTGRFADGLGSVQDVPERMGFDAIPHHGIAIWMLTQMKRWGYLKDDVDYQAIAQKVFMLTDAKAQMQKLGYQLHPQKPIVVMGKAFDEKHPKQYLSSFAIGKQG